MKKSLLLTICTIACGIICGCTAMGMGSKPTPDFYPNDRYLHSPPAEVQQYEAECMNLASQYVKEPNKYQNLAKDGLEGGVIGAATGAVGGAIAGNAGRGTGAGAAIGGMLGILKGLKDMNEPSPSYERFVEHCLSQHGYSVIGWSSK